VDWSTPVPHEYNPRGVYEEFIETLHNDSYRLIPDDALLRNSAQVEVNKTLLHYATNARLTVGVSITLIRGMEIEEVDGTGKVKRMQNMDWRSTILADPYTGQYSELKSYKVMKPFKLESYLMYWTDKDGTNRGWGHKPKVWKVPLQTIFSVQAIVD
tara:strand:+ start:77 stop:547 length:471 start_codon:yes stop_codon:yes gene_type:complete